MKNVKSIDEWFSQADYDLSSAEVMLKAGKYVYAVFMCHLAVEKALKGIYVKTFKANPPKIHNLVYLIEKTGLKLPEDLFDFVYILNGLSIPTRYPDSLHKLLKEYDRNKADEIYKSAKRTLKWLKEKR